MVDHVFPVLPQNEEADIPPSDCFDQTRDWGKLLPDNSNNQEDESQPIEENWRKRKIQQPKLEPFGMQALWNALFMMKLAANWKVTMM